MSANLSGASETDLVHLGMVCEHRPKVIITAKTLKDSRWEIRPREFTQFEAAIWSEGTVNISIAGWLSQVQRLTKVS
jgi:hypothetical protein